MSDAPEMEEWEINQARLYIANLCPSRVRDYVIKIELERIDALAREAKLREAFEQVREQWALAMYGATENGVACLNEQAAQNLPKDFVKFGEWLTALSYQHPTSGENKEKDNGSN